MNTQCKTLAVGETGLIQVYTSPSKKINYAPFGLALRASGHGLRTLIARFAPHGLMGGEKQACEYLAPNLVIDASVPDGFRSRKGLVAGKARDVFQKAGAAALAGIFDVVILDGILDLISSGAIQIEALLEIMYEKDERVELVLSGFEAADEIMEKADLVTEMTVHASVHERLCQPIEVVTGNGKGKTTYCLGKSLLMSCMNVRSYVLQMIKSPKPYGEVMAIENLPGLEIETLGKGFVDKENPGTHQSHLAAAREAWERGKKVMLSSRYGLVALDEINIAVNCGFIHSEEIQDLFLNKPEGVHLMLSGRYAHPDLMKSATMVMEMKEIKHPFNNGVRSRRGIEY